MSEFDEIIIDKENREMLKELFDTEISDIGNMDYNWSISELLIERKRMNEFIAKLKREKEIYENIFNNQFDFSLNNVHKALWFFNQVVIHNGTRGDLLKYLDDIKEEEPKALYKALDIMEENYGGRLPEILKDYEGYLLLNTPSTRKY